MVDIVGVLKPVADEVRALADDGLADLARPLAGDDKRKTEFTPLLGDPFISKTRKAMSPILIGSGWTSIIVCFLEHQNPGIPVARSRRQALTRFQL
jgi:hypothetical protein